MNEISQLQIILVNYHNISVLTWNITQYELIIWKRAAEHLRRRKKPTEWRWRWVNHIIIWNDRVCEFFRSETLRRPGAIRRPHDLHTLNIYIHESTASGTGPSWLHHTWFLMFQWRSDGDKAEWSQLSSRCPEAQRFPGSGTTRLRDFCSASPRCF